MVIERNQPLKAGIGGAEFLVRECEPCAVLTPQIPQIGAARFFFWKGNLRRKGPAAVGDADCGGSLNARFTCELGRGRLCR